MNICRLDSDESVHFPAPESALSFPAGLLAFGGGLSPRRLVAAYKQGIYPFFDVGDPVLWWSPDPRCIFNIAELKVGRGMRKLLRSKAWTLTVDRCFEDVLKACAEPRQGNKGSLRNWKVNETLGTIEGCAGRLPQHASWIVPAMVDAYKVLHKLGYAHSIEVWDRGCLIGGLFGVAVGGLFCGESMFSRESGASKIAFVGLAALLRISGFSVIDAQVSSHYMLSLGAKTVTRAEYLHLIKSLVEQPCAIGSWRDFTASFKETVRGFLSIRPA